MDSNESNLPLVQHRSAATVHLVRANGLRSAQQPLLRDARASLAWYLRDLVRYAFASGDVAVPREGANVATIRRIPRTIPGSDGTPEANPDAFTGDTFKDVMYADGKRVFSVIDDDVGGDEFKVDGYIGWLSSSFDISWSMYAGVKLADAGLVIRTGGTGQNLAYDNSLSRKFLGAVLNNSLNVRHILWIPAVRPLDTLLREGLPHGDLHVQQLQRPFLDRRRRGGNVESRLSRPRGLDPVHRGRSELLEQSREVVDVLARARAFRGRLPPGLRRALGLGDGRVADRSERATGGPCWSSRGAAPSSRCGACGPRSARRKFGFRLQNANKYWTSTPPPVE